MAKNASRRYAELDARARENLKQIRPEQSDPASIDATMSRLWRSVARTRAELSVLDRLWRAGRIAVEGVEYMDAARAAGRPILGVVLHLGNWEAMGVASVSLGSGWLRALHLALLANIGIHPKASLRAKIGGVGKATGPRERAAQAPRAHHSIPPALKRVGTALSRLCPPYDSRTTRCARPPRPERSRDRRCGSSGRRTCARSDDSAPRARASCHDPRARRGCGN